MGLSVRQATSDDLPHALDMARAFHAYSPWSHVDFDAQAVSNLLFRSIEQGGVFVSEGGLCAGTVAPLMFNPAVVIGVEFAWWCTDRNGKQLREAFEAWCRTMGATDVQYSALVDSHLPAVTRLYERAGRKAMEVAFVGKL